MLKKLCCVTLLLHPLFALAFSQDICGCRYLFMEQPSNSVMCNPYPMGMFVTRCMVTFSTTEGIPLSLDWYSKAHLTNAPQLITSGFSSDNGALSVGSVLTVSLAPEMADNHEGYRYFCRVKFANGTIFKDSQEVYLFPRNVVTNILDYPDCDQGSVQSTQFEECIDPKFNEEVSTTEEPTTQPPTTPPQPPTTAPPTDPPTTPPPPPPTTLPPTTPPPTTPAPPPPTTPSQPPPPPPTTSPPPPPSTTALPTTARPPAVRNSELTFEEEIMIYVAIAAAVVLTLVVILLLLCLCLWNRVCRQSKYCTCCL